MWGRSGLRSNKQNVGYVKKKKDKQTQWDKKTIAWRHETASKNSSAVRLSYFLREEQKRIQNFTEQDDVKETGQTSAAVSGYVVYYRPQWLMALCASRCNGLKVIHAFVHVQQSASVTWVEQKSNHPTVDNISCILHMSSMFLGTVCVCVCVRGVGGGVISNHYVTGRHEAQKEHFCSPDVALLYLWQMLLLTSLTYSKKLCGHHL